jgi:sugar/nucleoside kinase (ribokinase family)
VTSWTPYAGGAPLNVVTACAKLGLSSGFISALGDDALGQDLLDLMADRGVDATAVERLPNRKTRDVLVTRTEDGDRQVINASSSSSPSASSFSSPPPSPSPSPSPPPPTTTTTTTTTGSAPSIYVLY